MSTAKQKRHKIDRPRAPGAPLSILQVAAELNVAPRTVRKRIDEGKLRAYRDGRLVRVLESELIAYQAALMSPQVAVFPPSNPVGRPRHLKPPKAKPARRA